MTPNFRRTVLLAAWTIGVCAVAAKPAATLPGLQLDGSVLLPNQWSLRPAGRQILVGDFPVNIALHPGGVFAAVMHSGWGQHEVRVLNVKSGRPVSQVALAEAFYGLAWSEDGKTLFASGAGSEVVHVFAFADGFLSGHRELRLRPAEETGVPAGLAASADGAALYVAELWGQRVEKISTADGHALWTRQLASAQHTAISMPEEERLKAGYDPEAPYPYTCVADEKHGRVFVSLWAASTVLVLDAATGAEVGRWKVGSHPNEMVLAGDGRLFVAESNLNSVSVIDTANGRVTETLASTQRVAERAGEIAADARDAETAALAVSERSERGRAATTEALMRLGEIDVAARETEPALEDLRRKSGRIREFTDQIASIASHAS